MTKRDKGAQMLRESIQTVDTELGAFVSARMCSNICPCDLDFDEEQSEEKAAWLAVLNDGEKLAEFDRCLRTDPDCELEKQIIYTDGTGPTILEMTGYEMDSYSSFFRCFDDLKDGKRDTEQVSEEDVKKYEKMAQGKEYQAGFNLVKSFEKRFDCSGICDTQLFYYTRPMNKGPPTSTCILHMKNAIANNLTYMGMASTMCGLIMVFMWLCQYTLWKRNYYDEPKK